ncbi:MAG TPA: DUF4258 domain-containing protein [Anaerolineales bacterium]|nr:DUF4258 domain-containing protein [Anaerolineales bacterium]
MNNPKIFFRVHAVQRMFERKVTVGNVSQALQLGEIIEDYSAEMPEPGRLILGFQGKRPIHVVASENPETNEVTVVTVYIPDPQKWDKNFKGRRS